MHGKKDKIITVKNLSRQKFWSFDKLNRYQSRVPISMNSAGTKRLSPQLILIGFGTWRYNTLIKPEHIFFKQ